MENLEIYKANLIIQKLQARIGALQGVNAQLEAELEIANQYIQSIQEKEKEKDKEKEKEKPKK